MKRRARLPEPPRELVITAEQMERVLAPQTMLCLNCLTKWDWRDCRTCPRCNKR